MFHRSLISIVGVLQGSDLFKLLEKFGAKVVTSSIKSFSFDNSDFLNLQTPIHTYVTSNKYTLWYLGEEFALSYSTVEGSGTEKGDLGSSTTYI